MREAEVLGPARRLGELAKAVGGNVRGDPGLVIRGVNVLADAGEGELSFYNNPRYREALKATKASAVVVTKSSVGLLGERAAIVVSDPSLSFARLSALFHPRPRFDPGVDPRAVVEPGGEIDPTATVMALSFVGRDARVGARSVLFPGSFLGDGSVLGADSILYPGAVVREGCQVGDRTVLQPGAVVGADGFGYAFDPKSLEHVKIPQIGRVVIGDDVEIGASSTVDRATLGETSIGRGTKIDNLVQIGHNVRVGERCILCGQVGIAGSSTLGSDVVCGGQVGIANHARICDRARIGPQSGVMADVEEPEELLGSPVMKAREWMRAQAAFQHGAETARQLKRLQQQVALLEARLAAIEPKK